MTGNEATSSSKAALVHLYEKAAGSAFDFSTVSDDVADIANRWESVPNWAAPLRNPLWVESEEGTPVAAVSGSFIELMSGEIERRRQVIARAPSDIRALLEVIRELRLQSRAGRQDKANARSAENATLASAPAA